jgi:hypothetical protein
MVSAFVRGDLRAVGDQRLVGHGERNQFFPLKFGERQRLARLGVDELRVRLRGVLFVLAALPFLLSLVRSELLEQLEPPSTDDPEAWEQPPDPVTIYRVGGLDGSLGRPSARRPKSWRAPTI